MNGCFLSHYFRGRIGGGYNGNPLSEEWSNHFFGG